MTGLPPEAKTLLRVMQTAKGERVGLADPEPRLTRSDLAALFGLLLGDGAGSEAMAQVERAAGHPIEPDATLGEPIAGAAEAALAPLIGEKTARDIVQRAFRLPAPTEPAPGPGFSYELLHTTLESLSQGVSVVNAELKLVAWNNRYLEMLHYPPGLVYVGRPIEDIVRFSAQQMGYTEEEVEAHVERRLKPMLDGAPSDSEREFPNRTLRLMGSPMPGGGYVSTYTDITELRAAARAAAEANEQLERRVRERTQELTGVNLALEKARAQAELATRSQVRFVAAASHDLLQPLHAARLFLGALQETPPEQMATLHRLAGQADQSIDAADRLLRALLNLSRLEVGGVRPDIQAVQIETLLAPLRQEFEPLATRKGLRLAIPATRAWVSSDPDLLRSVLQNLLGNAIRYTARGSVALVCRPAPGEVRFEVRDSGPGVAAADLPLLFQEFQRGGEGVRSGTGAGLGLAIAQRICRLLGHRLDVRSQPGRGSTFSVAARRTEGLAAAVRPPASGTLRPGLKVLCVENEPAVLESMEVLLRRWGVRVTGALKAEDALALDDWWDVILADYHLDGPATGMDLLEALVDRGGAFALVTASVGDAVSERARSLAVEVLRKPLAPASLRAFLARASQIGGQRRADP